MTFGVGAALVVMTLAMIVVGRPRNGVSPFFLKVWFAGQLYILTALTSATIGAALMIANLPL
jgi:hypothetical protein